MSDYYSSDNNPAKVKEIAERFGFCLVRDVFSSSEMESIEQEVGRLAKSNNNQFPDLYSCPSLRWIMLDRRVLELAKALLGKNFVYYRETNIAFEENPGPLTHHPYRDLHCDARGNVRDLDGPWNGETGEIFGAYRFGLYFRNYRDFSGGIKIAPGTHRVHSTSMKLYQDPAHAKSMPRLTYWLGGCAISDVVAPPFELINVPSLPGDLVVFNLRTYHSAGALRFASRPTLALMPYVESSLESTAMKECLPKPPGSRNAIFFDYGKPSEEVDFYIKWRALRRSEAKLPGTELLSPNASLFQIRNDYLIVSLALTLADALDQFTSGDNEPSLNDLAPYVREDAEMMLALCARHREFSQHHALFDRTKFESEVGKSSIKALQYVVEEIRQKRRPSAA